MRHLATGEATPSISTLMAAHNEREAALNNHTACDDVDKLDRQFHDAIKALLDPGLACRSATDAVGILRYALDAFEGEDSLFDALLPTVIAWAEKLAFSETVSGLPAMATMAPAMPALEVRA